MRREPESLVIRPPSEWRSLLVRLTRGCNWNRCRFCGIYPAMGEPGFSRRSLDEIVEDIDMLLERHPSPETAFFGDADPLAAGIHVFSGAARHLRSRLPGLKRLTCYARASTLKRLGREAVAELSSAGLDRVHIGLESGDARILRFQKKGQSPKMVETVAAWLKDAGIEVSFYVLLGIGGQGLWQDHARETALLINRTAPDFVRIRRLWLYTEKDALLPCPLWEQVEQGNFMEQTPEGTVRELELMLECLEPVSTFIACDHANNFINIAGNLATDRDDMLYEVQRFLALPEDVRMAHYRAVGSRI